MTKTFGAAVLALAAVASLAGAASAQEGFRYRDLDLSTPQGVQTLNNRIASAAVRSCASEQGTGSRTTGGTAACEREFRRAALEVLPQAQREQVRAVQAGANLVSAR